VYCSNIFIGLTSVTFLSAPLQVMKVNACGCYSFSVSSVQLTQFEDSQCHFFLVGWGQGRHLCVPQFPTPNSSYTTTSTPQFIPCHNPQPGGADTSLCLTAHWTPGHHTSTAYEFTYNEMASCCTFGMPTTRCCTSVCSWATEGFHSNLFL